MSGALTCFFVFCFLMAKMHLASCLWKAEPGCCWWEQQSNSQCKYQAPRTPGLWTSSCVARHVLSHRVHLVLHQTSYSEPLSWPALRLLGRVNALFSDGSTSASFPDTNNSKMFMAITLSMRKWKQTKLCPWKLECRCNIMILWNPHASSRFEFQPRVLKTLRDK